MTVTKQIHRPAVAAPTAGRRAPAAPEQAGQVRAPLRAPSVGEGQTAVGTDVLAPEPRRGSLREFGVRSGFLGPAEHAGRLGHDPGRAGEVGVATGCQGGPGRCAVVRGPAVSSQSPNMKPPSGKSSTTPARSENAVNQLAILDHWSSRSWASPCRWYSTHGTTIAASPQPASACSAGNPGGWSARKGRKSVPRRRCPSARRPGQRARSGACRRCRSGRTRWARIPEGRRSSPDVRPAAGNRWARERSCPRMPQMTLSCRRFTPDRSR